MLSSYNPALAVKGIGADLPPLKGGLVNPYTPFRVFGRLSSAELAPCPMQYLSDEPSTRFLTDRLSAGTISRDDAVVTSSGIFFGILWGDSHLRRLFFRCPSSFIRFQYSIMVPFRHKKAPASCITTQGHSYSACINSAVLGHTMPIADDPKEYKKSPASPDA